MNILYLCDEYPPGRHGGIGTLVQLLARQMVQMGHTVVVAGFYSPGFGGADYFEDEGVKVYRYRWGIDSKWFEDQQALSVRIIRRLMKDTGVADRQVRKGLRLFKNQLEELISTYAIDIVEMPDYNDCVKYCKSAVHFPVLSVPVVVKLNGCMTYFSREAGQTPSPAIFKTEQQILNQANAVSSASLYTAHKTAAYLHYSKHIDVLYNGINLDIPGNIVPKVANQVIFTGSLMQKKGIYQLAQAWNLVIEQAPDARLLILGRGDQQKVKARLSAKAASTVTFGGHVDAKTLYHHLKTAQVAVFPSYAEAFALAPLEAMACGTAVINSNRTSGPELIEDDVDGLLIDPDDIHQIASAILSLLNDQALCSQLAEKGNEKVREHFEISKVAEQNLRFYQQVLNSRQMR